MKCSESISLIIKVLKSLFVQIIDGLNFGHIYDRVSSTSITEIFCVANKRFVRFAVVRVNRDGRYEIVFRLDDVPTAKIIVHFNFFNEIMCEGIAVGKTERLNFKVVILKVLEEEGNRRHDIICIKVFVVSLKSK